MLFSQLKIGPISLRNRSIRAAAFEGMCPGHQVTQQLIDYHQAVARGGIGMTTVAYAAVQKSGLSFSHQLWLRSEILADLQKITDAVHSENAAISIQLGHGGNMAKYDVSGTIPIAPNTHFNIYGPTLARAMNRHDISTTVSAFGASVRLAREAGFDAVEIHAGHGYLISQFLSPATNKRKDEFGGSLQNRMRFMNMVINEVLDAAAGKIAVLVKMNMQDGFRGGMSVEESIETAKQLEILGVDAIILSGGFVSRAPMYILRGAMPLKTLSRHINNPLVGLGVRWFGNHLIPEVAFRENYFLDDARQFRRQLKLPLVYVGGILSRENIDEALHEGFDAVAIARALIIDPNFINKLFLKHQEKSACDTCNHCIAVMYNGPFSCIQNEKTGI